MADDPNAAARDRAAAAGAAKTEAEASVPIGGAPPEELPPEAMPPEAMPPEAMPPEAMPPEAMPPEAMPPEEAPQGILSEAAKQEAATADVGEYSEEELEAMHDSMIDEYHDAIAYGDKEKARTLRKQLSHISYLIHAQAGDNEKQMQAESEQLTSVANQLAQEHPELETDSEKAEQVLALSMMYREKGVAPAEALQKAVGVIFPGSAVEPAMEEELPAEEAVEMPDMADKELKKRALSSVPSASAKPEAPKEEAAPTQQDVIAMMKQRRGQA